MTDLATQRYGADYLLHQPNGLTTQAVKVDNGTAQFSTTGTWVSNAANSTTYGTTYLSHIINDIAPTATIVDNTSASFSVTGTWSTVSTPATDGFYGTNYRSHATAASTTDKATWLLNVPSSGSYRVYAYWPSIAATAAGNASFTIYHSSGSTTVSMCQYCNTKRFNLLGTFTLAPGQNHRIELSGAGNGAVQADAIAFEPVSALPSTATWQLPVASAGQYRLFARWPTLNLASFATPFLVHHDLGDTTLTWQQYAKGGRWNYLGTFGLTPGANPHIDMTDRGSSYDVLADAVAYDPVSAPVTNIATWTPTLPASGQYRVYARWPADTSRATNASYTVTHAGGASTVTVNQTLRGGQWVLLGTYQMTAGAGHNVKLNDQADGFVAADAMAFEPVASTPTTVKAVWTPAIAASGPHLVWARWCCAFSGSASSVPYTIYYTGGSTTVLKDQTANNGGWVLLGTFDMAPGQNHRVELGDRLPDGSIPSGLMVADAVAVEPVAALGNGATWTPAITDADTYEVFARWAAGTDGATNARFTVTHGGGATNVTVNQQSSNGAWVSLGSYAMAPGAGHKIQLSDHANGVVVADAVKLVSSSGVTRYATWAGTATSAGTYQVYARIPSPGGGASVLAPDAAYSLIRPAGSQNVTLDQSRSVGWKLLGSMALAANDNRQVKLSDQASSGQVA